MCQYLTLPPIGVVDRGGAGFSRLDSGITPSCYVSFPTGFLLPSDN